MKKHDIEWRFHCLYNLQAVGLLERKNGILKQQIKLLTNKTSMTLWTKVLPQGLMLEDQPVGPVAPHARLGILARTLSTFWKL